MGETPAKPSRVAIIVTRATFECLHLASSYAAVAAACKTPVRMFFGQRSATALRKGVLENVELPSDVAEESERLREKAKKLGAHDILGYLRAAKQIGDTKIFVCSTAAKLFDLTRDDLIPEVDGLIGTGAFYSEEAAAPGAVVLTF